MSEGALSGLRVIDFGQMVAGPFSTKLFADYGADVIKVEPPSGDMARTIGPYPGNEPHPEKSGLFYFVNTSKRGVTLDHTTEKGRELLLELIKGADILVDTYLPKEMKAWGLDHDTLSKVNPNLVQISVTPYGQTGPYANWKGYDLNCYHIASTGVAFCGRPGETVLEPGTYTADFFTSAAAATFGLSAVYGRDAIGKGQHVDVSIAETLASSFSAGCQITKAKLMGEGTYRTGFGLPITAPATIMPCKDGHMWMLALEPGHWIGLMKCMGNPEWGMAEEMFNPMVRGEQAAMIYEKVGEWIKDYGKIELMEMLQANGVPSSAVFCPEELATHPHLLEREFINEVNHPVMGLVKNIGAVFAPGDCPATLPGPAPLLGQHNEQVFGELGVSKDALASLKSQGVI